MSFPVSIDLTDNNDRNLVLNVLCKQNREESIEKRNKKYFSYPKFYPHRCVIEKGLTQSLRFDFVYF